jgi:proteasome lid subunit RPN8/RPN11|tara:strand:- start:552 stop:980 length:429 start_codon:yes stop_codon:yes gene_type:complete
MIFFPNNSMRQIIIDAEESCPEEACGLLWGKRCEGDVHVSSVHRSKNCAEDPRTKFEINPQLRFDLERLAREGEMDVVGLYHSHPNGPAKPSKIDLSRAWETALTWVIIGLEEGKVVEKKAYKVEKPKERFVEIDIQVVNSQ